VTSVQSESGEPSDVRIDLEIDRVDRFSVELSRFVRLDRFQGIRPNGGFGASHLADVCGSLARTYIRRTGWPRQSALSTPLSFSTVKQLFLQCNPKGLDRSPSLTSFEGTRAALSWSTCCIRHNSGTKRGTSRKSQFRRTWAVSEYASVSSAVDAALRRGGRPVGSW